MRSEADEINAEKLLRTFLLPDEDRFILCRGDEAPGAAGAPGPAAASSPLAKESGRLRASNEACGDAIAP